MIGGGAGEGGGWNKDVLGGKKLKNLQSGWGWGGGDDHSGLESIYI